jgi:hypothetical protein
VPRGDPILKRWQDDSDGLAAAGGTDAEGVAKICRNRDPPSFARLHRSLVAGEAHGSLSSIHRLSFSFVDFLRFFGTSPVEAGVIVGIIEGSEKGK